MARQHFVIVGGLAGSGKSETGRRLAQGLSAAYLDKDTISRGFVEELLELASQDPHDRESDHYLTRIRPLEYEQILRVGFENLECGRDVVVSAPFIAEAGDLEWFDSLLDEVEARGGELTAVWVRADPTAMQRYLSHRGAPRDRWKRTHWDEYLELIDWSAVPKFPHQLIDNSEQNADCAPLTGIRAVLNEMIGR